MIGVQAVAVIVQLGMLVFQLWLWHETKQSEKRNATYYSRYYSSGKETNL
ncbi:hypothetical protein [Rothia koreensis]